MSAYLSARSPQWGTDGTVTMVYVVVNVKDDFEAIGQAAAASPPTYYQLQRQANPQIDPLGHDCWEVTFQFKPPQVGIEVPPEIQPGEGIGEFDTGGGTQHITQAVYAQWWWPPNAAQRSGINETDDGIEGVDVTIPKLTFNLTRRWHLQAVTGLYVQRLAVLTGAVNNAPYYIDAEYASGELLFLGARGTARGLPYWEITYSFEASANRADIPWARTVPFGNIPVKLGHDYLWFSTRKASFDANGVKRTVEQVDAAYVARVYPYLHFPSFLGF